MNKKAFLITGVFLVLAAVAIVIGVKSRSAGASYDDGEWTGSAEGRNGPISLSLTVANGKVTGGRVLSEDETDFAKPAIQTVIDQFVKTQNVAKLDTVSGATITSKATINAIGMALALAKGETVAASASTTADVTCDIVVIGAGGAGLSAATEASSKGAKVILLEKMGIAGGNTNSATGGLNASETKVQAGLGIADSNEQYYQDTMKGGYNLNDPELVRNMVEKSSETVDWLMSLGADLSDVGKMAGSTNSRTHRPQGGAAIGVHLVPVLEKAAKDAGVEIRYNSKVTDIIEEDGKAVGVTVSSASGDY
ncbi:MAG: FAD-dependent oxidoreductase, partial [Treponema sp.]|nr:FAD-dependent oxidoreductase [Treponema sp.]